MQRVLRKILYDFRKRKYSIASNASSSKDLAQWDIFVAVALCRRPLVAPPMTDVEKEYADVVSGIEKEGSLLSDFELQEMQDRKLLAKRAELEAQNKDLSELDEKIKVTAMAQQDEWEKRGELLKQKYSIGDLSKIENDSETSLWRKLDRQLVLIVKQRFKRKDNYASPWVLPQLLNQPGETLRQTAERCIGEITSGDVKVRVTGNAPFSSFSYRYPKNLKRECKNDAVGGKIFFFNSFILQREELQINAEEASEYKWVTAEEFFGTVHPLQYRKALTTLFIE